MDVNKYNGWENKATWNFSLWINSDNNINKLMIDFFTRQEWGTSPSDVKRWGDMMFGDRTPDGDLLSDVDWVSIANGIKAAIGEVSK